MKQTTRKEKEDLYRQKVTKLQRQWGNPINPSDFDHVQGMSDQELDEQTKETVGQLRFEKGYFVFTIIMAVAIGWIGKLVWEFLTK